MADKSSRNEATETERLVKVLHEALDRVAEHAGGAEEQVRDSAASVQERVRSTGRQVSAKGGEAANVIEEYVDDHPWAAVGLAFGAGIILSSMLRR
jgi:ElaB/YqjD/DUF883 family membrane-anchored ribosome-binding protein